MLDKSENCKTYELVRKCGNEQKEYCECKESGLIWNKNTGKLDLCMNCGKPIPAEKKECVCKEPEPYFDNDFHPPVRCINCGKPYYNPEPKPKERRS